MRLFNKEEVETAFNTNSKRGPAVFASESGLIKFESNLFSKEDGLLVKRVRPIMVVSTAPQPSFPAHGSRVVQGLALLLLSMVLLFVCLRAWAGLRSFSSALQQCLVCSSRHCLARSPPYSPSAL